jgi:subtilase family serine protease
MSIEESSLVRIAQLLLELTTTGERHLEDLSRSKRSAGARLCSKGTSVFIFSTMECGVKVSRLFVLTVPLWLTLAGAPTYAMVGAVRPERASLSPGRPEPLAGAPRVSLRDLGRAPATTRVRLAVVLNYRHDAELQQFVALQGEQPAGSRMALSAQQFRDYFAPSAQDYARTATSLMDEGFTITHTYANRTVIDVSAPAAVAERAFATEFHLVRQADGSIHYANLKPAYLPESLKGLVFGVIGFDNLRVLHPMYVRGSALHSFIKVGPPLQAPDLGFGPFVFSTAYDLPVQHAVAGGKAGQTYDGSGQAAAVVIDADFLDSDLAAFLTYFHVKRTGPKTVRVPINGGPPPGLIPDSAETTLDVETIVGNAPGVALYVYEMDSLSPSSTIDAYNQINADDRVGAVNSSFGGCEDQTTPANYPQLSNHLALQGNALGIVYAAASGDYGTYECTTNFGYPGGVSSPASGPSFVAVGGTTLFPHLNGTYSREIGWYNSGGGVSDIFSMPSYQIGIKNTIPKWRNLPDVAFDGDPNSGAAFYISGGWFGPIGGTSLASPIFTALAVELAQYGHCRLGNMHPALYHAFTTYQYNRPVGAALFHDAIGGNNGYYTATPGFDQLTGIGSIDGWNFAVTTHL